MHKSLITKVIYPSIVLSLIVGCAGIATSERFRAETVSPIAQDVQSRRVSQIAVDSLAPGQETFVAVTCDALRELSDQIGEKRTWSGSSSLSCWSLTRRHTHGLLKEKVICDGEPSSLAGSGACLHTICLDGGGTTATFDGRPARINLSSAKMVQEALSPGRGRGRLKVRIGRRSKTLSGSPVMQIFRLPFQYF
jgi:hypothetical protein